MTLKAPIGVAAAGQVNATRKKFRGTLERAEVGASGWQIVWSAAPAAKPGQRISKKRLPAPVQALGFTLSEIKEARLAPVVAENRRRTMFVTLLALTLAADPATITAAAGTGEKGYGGRDV